MLHLLIVREFSIHIFFETQFFIHMINIFRTHDFNFWYTWLIFILFSFKLYTFSYELDIIFYTCLTFLITRLTFFMNIRNINKLINIKIKIWWKNQKPKNHAWHRHDAASDYWVGRVLARCWRHGKWHIACFSGFGNRLEGFLYVFLYFLFFIFSVSVFFFFHYRFLCACFLFFLSTSFFFVFVFYFLKILEFKTNCA